MNICCLTVPPSRVHLVPSVRLPVIAGTLVSFNCTCEHVYPNPLFQWYKNDQLIQRLVNIILCIRCRLKCMCLYLLVQSAMKHSFQVHRF